MGPRDPLFYKSSPDDSGKPGWGAPLKTHSTYESFQDLSEEKVLTVSKNYNLSR